MKYTMFTKFTRYILILLTRFFTNTPNDLMYSMCVYCIVFYVNFFQLTPDKCKTLLIQALCNILMKCKETKYRIVALRVNNEPCSSENVHDNERPCYSKAASNEIFHENQVNTHYIGIDEHFVWIYA